METQVVIAKLAATIFVEAEDPLAAMALVERTLADIETELGGFHVRIGIADVTATKAFTEGLDPPGHDDD